MASDSSCTEASEPSTSAASCITKQRKKRKWDQPAESLIAAGLVVPGTLPMSVIGSVVGVTHPILNPFNYSLLPSSIPAVSSTISQFLQGSTTVDQNATALLQKLNQQPKTQLELIAREIVINDAEPTVRYRLTKRQTQEEILKITGAIVITRGKYHPLNGLSDGERPLYLHISAGAHLKDTTERIKAVDHAASMIDGFLKQGPNSQLGLATLNAAQQTGLVAQPLSACVFLGFEPDESLNIAERIRGPNDQYISHIMNVTGATVVLQGQGLGNSGVAGSDGKQQPIHLFLTSNTARSLEEARILAENLLDTISAECGTSRISSSKVYNAVPPPQQLLTGVESSTAGLNKSGTDTGRTCHNISSSSEASLAPTLITSTSATAFIPMITPVATSFQSNTVPYPQIRVPMGTNYSGYGGIYPQATPLQQVALALKQAPTVHPSTTSIHASATTSLQETSLSRKTKPLSSEPESRRQRRKFQEQTVTPVETSPVHQVFSLTFSEDDRLAMRLRSGASLSDLDVTKASVLPPPQKFILPAANGIPPPPPKNISIPSSRDLLPPPPRVMLSPPPPKFTASASPLKPKSKNTDLGKQRPEALPAPLLQLMDYGEEEDDEDESINDFSKRETESPRVPISKPFWAV